MFDLRQHLSRALAARYTIERELGHGGMSRVYLAQDLQHHRPVALKVLRPELTVVLGVERFLREIEIASRLHHPHILPLLDSDEADGLLYYVMPYAGESLRERLIRERQLPLPDTIAISRQVADALQFAHSQDLVHRDIKPENILLTGDGAMVADFGIARAITVAGGDLLTSTGIVVGTPTYMSPEQGAGEPRLDGRSDVFSLGCVVYEMLSGTPPFVGATAQAIQARRVADPVPPLRTVREAIPEPVEVAIERALAKVPADRFTTAAQFADALTGGSIAPKPRWRALGDRWVRRGVAVALILVVGIALWWISLLSGLTRRSPSALAQRISAMPDNSIAVMYFDNLTRDTSYAYLADGLTEDLISLLGRVARLDVKSRYESARIRGAHGLALTDIGEQLHVAYLVGGSVQPGRNGRVHVDVELIETRSGRRVWGDRLAASSTDPLAVQESISTAVVQAVVGALLPEELAVLHRRATRDSAAYDLYLRGRFFVNHFELKQGLQLYHQALLHDSTFAPVWAGIAEAWYWGSEQRPAVEAFAHVREAAERALALDSSTASAYLALAQSAHQIDRDFPRAEMLARTAVALDPRLAEAHAFLSWVLIDRGRPDEALAETERAWWLDSLSVSIEVSRWNTFQLLGRASDVLALAREQHETYWEVNALLLLRRCAEAREVLKSAAEHSWIYYWEQTVAAACLGKKAEGRVALDSLIATARTSHVESSKMAAAYAAIGDVGEAFRLLDRSDENREWDILFVTAPWWWFAPLQADPRFLPLVRRLGLPWPAPQPQDRRLGPPV
jgi:serine/threonine protein kinase